VKVPKLVDVPLVNRGVVSDQHRVVEDLPHVQYSSLVKALNPDIDDHDLVEAFGGRYIPETHPTDEFAPLGQDVPVLGSHRNPYVDYAGVGGGGYEGYGTRGGYGTSGGWTGDGGYGRASYPEYEHLR